MRASSRGCQRGDLGAGAVVGGQLDGAQPVLAEDGRQGVAHLLHVGPGRLHPVADDGPRRPTRPAGEHPPLHRRDVLRLVDDDVREGAVVALLGQVAAVARRPVEVRRDLRLAGQGVELAELVPAVVLRLDLDGRDAHQLEQLVVERRVGRGERGVGRPGGGQRRHLVVAQHAPGQLGQRRAPGPQVVEQRPRLQHRPGVVERAAERRVAAQPRGEVLAVVLLDAAGLGPPLPGPPAQLDEGRGEGRAPAVVAARRPVHLAAAACDLPAADGDGHAPVQQLEVAQPAGAGPRAHQRPEDVDHAGRALHGDGRGVVPAERLDARAGGRGGRPGWRGARSSRRARAAPRRCSRRTPVTGRRRAPRGASTTRGGRT